MKKTAILIFCLLALTTFYTIISMKIPMNSDNASVILAAKSIYEGNIFLHNFTLVTESYYTTDMFFYVIAMLIFGFSPILMYVVPALIYTLILITSYQLIHLKHKNVSLPRILILICFVGIPGIVLSSVTLEAGMHMGTVLYFLLSIYFIEKSNSIKSYILYVTFITLAVIGDGFAIYIGCIPVILVCLLLILKEKNKVEEIKLITLTTLSIILGETILKIINAFGGFHNSSNPIPKFIDLESLGTNMYLAVHGILDLYDAYFFGRNIMNISTLKIIVHFFAFILVIYSLFKFVKIQKNVTALNRLDLILITGVIINISEYVFSTMPDTLATTRYLSVFILFSTILICRMDYFVKLKQTYLITLMLFYILTLVKPINFEIKDNNYKKLAEFLVKNQLSYGYGSYWVSAITTLESKGEVKVNQVVSNDNKYVQPFNWFSNSDWYNKEAHFLIDDSTNWGNINSVTAESTFGKPDEVLEFQQYKILVWKKNISPFLKH